MLFNIRINICEEELFNIHLKSAYETVEHLFECPQLSNLREALLPPCLNVNITLYSDSHQLKSTAQYYLLANRQRMKIQDQALSR